MKNKIHTLSAILDLVIVFSLFIFPSWDYAKSNSYSIYGAVWGKTSTIGIFFEDLFYNDFIAKFLICLSVGVLIFSALMLLSKKKVVLVKKIQIIACVILLITFFLYHCSVFSSYADYAICEMNVLGFLVSLICITNLIASFFISEKIVNEPLKTLTKTDSSLNTNTASISTQLIEYKKMLDNGLITEEDFTKIKEKILNI